MNSLDTLYFPTTALYSIRQYPIFLMFQKVHLLNLAEPAPGPSGGESSDSFIKSGFCQVHTPCPLGEDRSRFFRLVNDIRHRKDDYASQLSGLLLAAGVQPALPQEETERQLVLSLLSPDRRQSEATRLKRAERLWQARLVLALGEILDQEEEEIAANLALLDDEQDDLFKALHGEEEESPEENPLAELQQIERKLGAAHQGNLRKRFLAWRTLLAEGGVPECRILLTTNQDCGDLLLAHHEKTTGATGSLVAELELPGLIGRSDSEALAAAEGFVVDHGLLLAELQKAMAETLAAPPLKGEATPDSPLATVARTWQKALASAFPPDNFGRLAVRCYLLPGFSGAVCAEGCPPAPGPPGNGLLIIAD